MRFRLASLLIAALLLITAAASHAAAVELPIITLTPAAGPGDADGDGSINAQDVTAIMKYIVGEKKYVIFEKFADYNGDGRINSRDVVGVMNAIANGEV